MSTRSARSAKQDESRPAATDDGSEQPRFEIDAPSISLPKGGGAIKSIDEKFTVNPSNGTVSFSLPLPFTPARNGAVPPVRIAYDGGAGNSVAGLGWMLDLPSIRRATDRFIPRYDAGDAFMLGGADELVPALTPTDGGGWSADEQRAGDLTITRYRPRIDGDFARIEQIARADGESWWRVTTRDDATTFYGTHAGARIAEPGAPQRIYEWLPTIGFDALGNCAVYDYRAEDLAGVARSAAEAARHDGRAPFANLHLERVRYGNRTPCAADAAAPYEPPAAPAAFLFEAVFDYGDHDPGAPAPQPSPDSARPVRPDPFSSYRSGFEIRTYRLLRRVLMFHRFDELNGGEPCLVRSLDLTHEPSDAAAPEVSYLATATQSGYHLLPDGTYSKRSLPAIEFDYGEPAWQTEVRSASPDAVASLPAGVSGTLQWVDLYGEGIAGVFSEHEGAWLYAANLGDADGSGTIRLDTQKLVMPKPSFSGISGGTLAFEDLDADGSRQVVLRTPQMQGYFELRDDGAWEPFRTFDAELRIDVSEPHVQQLDLVGDGRRDVLVCEQDALVWHRSEGRGGTGEMRRAARSADEQLGPNVVFADDAQAVLLADMSGDGLTDIVRVRNRDVCYWPNLGYGRFGAKVAMTNPPAFDHPDRFDAHHVRLADVTGTGASDVLYLGRDGVAAYLNLAGNGWSERREIAPALPTGAPIEVATTDLFGNGTTCIVWSSGLPGDRDRPLRYIDLMGGRKPHLLRGYDNGLGKQVAFSYESSTWHYLKDKAAGRPWKTRLPFPVHCVSRVEVRDRIGGSRRVTSYRYHHGHYDHGEREFRGFGMVEQVDAEDFEHWATAAGSVVDRTLHQTPVLTKTWFHTGADDGDGDGTISDRFRDEHWDRELERQGFAVAVAAAEPAPAPSRIVPAPGAPVDPARADHRRDALRGCRGMVLRQEVFGIDAPAVGATPEQRRRELSPYSVATHSCLVELLQPAQDGRHAAVTVKESERIALHYDRDIADPRVEHTLNVVVDELGNVLQSATVAYARRTPDPAIPQAARDAQARTHVTYAHNELTNDAIDPAHHRLRRVSQASTYEITGLAPSGALYALADFATLLAGSTEIGHHEDERVPPPGTVFRRLLTRSQTLFYDATLRAPAPLHAIDARALPYESYELAYTDELLADVFAARATAEIMAEGRYAQRGAGRWWVASGRWEHLRDGEPASAAAARCFAHVSHVDPFGARTTIGHLGDYALLENETADAAGNRTRVTQFDLRTLNPRRIVDPNDNVTEALLDELGWVTATATRGKGDEGDDLSALTAWATPALDAATTALLAAPTSTELAAIAAQLLGGASARHVHDVHRFRDSGGTLAPVVATIVRELHAAVQPDSPVQVSFEYSNGAGTVQLTKVPAEPGVALQATIAADGSVTVTQVDTTPQLRWLGTGRKVVNNKGNAVKQYEPFFSVTHEFESMRELVASGVTLIRAYDPIDRLVRVDHPDGTFATTEHGAWAVAEHDRNDNVLGSRWHDERVNHTIDAALIAAGKDPNREAAAAAQTEAHAATPLRRHLDPLGRPLLEVAHAGLDGAGQPLLRATAYRRDPGGRVLTVTDPRAIRTIAYRYDMRGRLARYDSADSGVRLTLDNACGDALRAWDERGHELSFAYDDPLHRLTAKRVRGGDGPQPLDNVFERIVYGEDRTGDAAANLRTRIALHYDSAGRVEQSRFDWKGNLLTSARRFATDYAGVADWSGADPDAALDGGSFHSACTYDALDRIVERTAPDGSVHRPTFNAANLLETVRVTQDVAVSELVVKAVDYDERGQRRRVVLGNDVSTDYVHDRETFRLIRLTSRRGDGTPLQDLHHTYDPVGNLTQLVDACVPTVWFDGAIVTGESTYAYDPLYELTSASGREHAGQLAFGATDNAFDAAMLERHDPSDVLAWQNYTQRYAYDAAGNITQTAHSVQGGGGWTRDLAYAADSNRLLTSTVGPNSYAYAHHPAHGYVTAMPQLSLMRHTFKDELAAVARQVVNAGTPETTWYVYDGDGTRLRKVVERAAPAGGRGAKRFERYTIDGTELERQYDGAGALSAQRRTLHVMDDKDRVALVESELTPAGDVARRLIRYQGADQLGSSRLETDAAGRVVSYELYHPFGTTAYQAVDKTIVAAAKRFRYTGMERDDESGLEYHSARYYAPWLGRWIAPDTHADKLDGNRYAYVKNNPVVRRDRNGLFEEPVHGLLTYRLALAAGFSAQDAAKIAIATAGMDHNVQTRPGEETGERVEHILTGVTQEYHFLPQDKALGLIEGDIAGGVKDLDAFGKHLHTLEDVGFKDAPGPHNRSNDRALAPVVGIVGMTLLSAGVITILEAARGNWSTGALVGAGIAAAVGIAAGLFAIIFSFIALDVGHPTYETERGEHSHSFSHVADEAFQDPKANTKELLLIYDELRRAAVASGRAIGPADEAMARQAIRDVVGSDLAGHVGEGADNATDINRMLNAKQTDVLGGEAASYATVVNEMSSWRKDQIDVSLDRGREYEYAP